MAFNDSVLSQLLKHVPRHEFQKLANGHDGGRRSDALTRWSQFVALSVGHLGGRVSLRDIEATMGTQSQHRYHLGTRMISRSGLGRANESLSYRFYEQLFSVLYRRCESHAPGHGFRFKGKLFSLDGSLIDLSMKVFPWADYNRKKAAFKLHVGLDHDGLIPAFASLTSAKVSEIAEADRWNFPHGSVLVFDKGFNRYSWHKSLTNKGLIWVTRIRSNARYRVIERRSAPSGGAVTSDQTIRYTSNRAQSADLPVVRRIGYRDPDTNQHYVFTTNQFGWSAQTIADIYKQRWQVELFFKWIKQNLKIKAFLGTSENAVMTQILVALCLYLLLAFVKFQSKIVRSLQQMLRLIQINLFVRRPFLELLQPAQPPPPPDRQMRLALVRN